MTAIGILYPGHSAEDDYPKIQNMLGDDTIELRLVHTRLHSDDHTVEAMRAAGDEQALADGARELLAQGPLNSIVWACTSGSFAYGWDGANDQVAKLQAVANVPASSTSLAFAAALQKLGITRVTIAATYPENLASHFKTFLADAGITVLHLGSGGITTASEVGSSMGKEEVLEFAKANDHTDAEAILLPDTAMHTVEWLDDLETYTGKTVLTANQVSVWHGLQLADYNKSHQGLGTLFLQG